MKLTATVSTTIILFIRWKEEHCGYRHNFCSCEKKAWRKNQACTAKVVSITAMTFFPSNSYFRCLNIWYSYIHSFIYTFYITIIKDRNRTGSNTQSFWVTARAVSIFNYSIPPCMYLHRALQRLCETFYIFLCLLFILNILILVQMVLMKKVCMLRG